MIDSYHHTLIRQKEAEELRERMEREKRELQEFIGLVYEYSNENVFRCDSICINGSVTGSVTLFENVTDEIVQAQISSILRQSLMRYVVKTEISSRIVRIVKTQMLDIDSLVGCYVELSQVVSNLFSGELTEFQP